MTDGGADRSSSSRRVPSLDAFEAMAEAAFARLPEDFRALTEGVSFTVADFPDAEMLDSVGLADKYDLLGLFEGVGLPVFGDSPPTGQLPNRIWLFRRPILAFQREEGDSLEAIVAHVLVHEIGHHFGFSDADMEAIEQSAGADGNDR